MQRVYAFTLFIILTLATPSYAVEIYSLYQADCTQNSGAIIRADHEHITMLLHNGKTTTIPIQQIETVVRYNAIESPFTKLLTAQNQSYAWKVSADHNESQSFQGFAVGFWDNVVIFLDSQGATHVLEQDELVSLHDANHALNKQKVKIPSQTIQFQPPPDRSQCSNTLWPAPKETTHIKLVGNMIIADKFKIATFFRTMADGYLSLSSLSERTRFYSRPLLFDGKTRLGILGPLVEDDRDKKVGTGGFASMPLYLEFGGGTPYRFQSHVGIGANSWRYSETVKDSGAFVSEFKSHILHGVFVANLDGFTAAQSVWANNISIKPTDFPWLRQSLNHLTMLGIDVLNWSISYGYYFPVTALGYKNEFREILASQPAPVFQFGYATQDYQISMITFINNTSADQTYENNFATADMNLDSGEIRYKSPSLRPKDTKMSSYTLRINNTFNFYKNYQLELDGIYSQWQANEKAAHITDPTMTDMNQAAQIKNTYNYTSLGLRTALRVDLGQWVALKGECQFEHQDIQVKIDSTVGSGLSTKDTYQRLIARAVFELIL